MAARGFGWRGAPELMVEGRGLHAGLRAGLQPEGDLFNAVQHGQSTHPRRRVNDGQRDARSARGTQPSKEELRRLFPFFD